jgi:hypothetical protein
VLRKAFDIYDGREIEKMITDIKEYIIEKYYDITITILEKQ